MLSQLLFKYAIDGVGDAVVELMLSGVLLLLLLLEVEKIPSVDDDFFFLSIVRGVTFLIVLYVLPGVLGGNIVLLGNAVLDSSWVRIGCCRLVMTCCCAI